MARLFTTAQANKIIADHQRLLQGLSAVIGATDKCKAEIKAASDALAAREALKILRGIPVEEVNRDKLGIRVKTLRDSGYETIADLYAASVYALTAVHGISEDGAHLIKSIVNNIASKAMQGVKVRLSTDNKTPEATRLVSAVSQYRQITSAERNCQQLLWENRRAIETAIADLSAASGSLKWLFASKRKKDAAADAYRKLTRLMKDSYGSSVCNALGEVERIINSTDGEAWQNFAASPVQFFNVIEVINPGVLGNDDDVYGLPEELAREIQEESFFPDGLLCELRRYQEWGVKYTLHQGRVLLGDEMGLGKTVQAIATMVSLRNTGATHFVVVCPASVITNWCREIVRMSKLRVTKVHGADRDAALQSWLETGGVAVTTYETTVHFRLDDGFKYTLLVVDEAHYIKNPEAQRTIHVKNLALHADRLMFMTGTALENKVDEMIELIRVLRPSIASRVKNMAFMSSAPKFREEVAPVYYRRKREDVLTELPDLIEAQEWCSMNSEEEVLYERAVLSRNYAAARRVSWNVDDPRHSSKAMRLLDIVNDAEQEGRKVIVFSFFLDTIRKVTMLLGDRCMEPINGSVSPQRRQAIIDEFDAAPAGTVLAAQIQSGGTGLNIQSASVVVICEPQFKPSIENQAISRAYRMGQTRNVLVYRLLCEDTVDEKIMGMLADKQAIFEAFADKSVAASESMELDDKTFGSIIEEEIQRINAKRGAA